MTSIGLILAAGKSKRFGIKNKLAAELNGKALLTHACEAMQSMCLDHRLAVVEDPALDSLLIGFDILRPAAATSGIGDNISLALKRVTELNATKLLIILGDMPFVTTEILEEIYDACPEYGISIAKSEKRISVPVCFHKSQLKKMIKLSGDHGCLSIIKEQSSTVYVKVDDENLVDIDTAEALAGLKVFD